MNPNETILTLLSFGETGMEFITGQFHDSLDEDHVTLIGNFYSNVLGAAEESNGLFGPLPVAYKYDILLFLYAFNAFDPNLKDERVIKRKGMTRATILIFYPSRLDGVFSSQRKNIKSIIEKWCFENEINDIRKTNIKEINSLREKITSLIISQINNGTINLESSNNLIKATGKNIHLLETLANIYKRKIKLNIISNNFKLEQSIKRIIFMENFESIIEYKNYSDKHIYILNNIEIENFIMPPQSIVNNFSFKGKINGIFYFYSNIDSEDDGYFIRSLLKIIKNAPKNSILSLCLHLESGFSEIINNKLISSALEKEENRSISLINLNDHNSSIEFAIIDFIEKIVSQFS